MLMKLTTGVNFINSLQSRFFEPKDIWVAFLKLKILYVFIWQKNFDKKVSTKMLVKWLLVLISSSITATFLFRSAFNIYSVVKFCVYIFG